MLQHIQLVQYRQETGFSVPSLWTEADFAYRLLHTDALSQRKNVTKLAHLADLQYFPSGCLICSCMLSWQVQNKQKPLAREALLGGMLWVSMIPVISMLTVTATDQALCKWPQCQAVGVAFLVNNKWELRCPLLAMEVKTRISTLRAS